MKFINKVAATATLCISSFAHAEVIATQSPLRADPQLDAGQIVLKNDKFVDSGGQAYLQQGFVKGERAGVWLKVPDTVKKFKIDTFRILMGGGSGQASIFFRMQVATKPTTEIGASIENTAQVTVGNYFNDVPAQNEGGNSLCANPGQFVGAAVEFTTDGAPSVYRDAGPILSQNNVMMAIPGGWNYSSAFGLRGNWILRVVGHEAQSGECP